nr:retrovirus-related Pol polyprotein from transposon TNT 1-94 [Tanacetum cinerariifolium]
MRLIQSLASKELVRNQPKLKFDQHFCDACKIEKQAHASHKAKNIVLTTRCLELLRMDLFGPSAVRSYGGNRYTLVIVDYYSRLSCEEFAQEVFGFSDSSKSGNLTSSDPIITSSSPSFTPFEGSDFMLEEIETFLRTPNELSTSDNEFDQEEDIALIEKLLNEYPSPNHPPKKNKDLKQADVTMAKPSTKEPPDLELMDLPSHLEYAF